MMRKHRPNRQLGQSLVEAALALPLVLLLLAGATDLGRAYFAYVSITNAAREGARYGAGYPPFKTDYVAKIKARTQNELSNSGIAVASNDITVSCSTYDSDSAISCSSASAGDRVKVQVTYTFTFITGLVFRLGSLTISNSATMAIDS